MCDLDRNICGVYRHFVLSLFFPFRYRSRTEIYSSDSDLSVNLINIDRFSELCISLIFTCLKDI